MMKRYAHWNGSRRNRALLILAVLAAAYLAICLTPAHRLAIRLFPDAARFFHPPLFFYNEDFSSGKIGAFRIGQTLQDVRNSAEETYGVSISYEACSPNVEARERLFAKSEQCMRTKSKFGMAPIFWIFGFKSDRLISVRVRTEVPLEF